MGRSVFDGVSDGSWAVFAEKAVAARDAAIEAAVKAKAEMQAELDLARSLHDVAVRQRDAANWLVEQVTKEREEARVALTEADQNVGRLIDSLATIERAILEALPYKHAGGEDADPAECVGYAAEELALVRQERDEARAEVERLRSALRSCADIGEARVAKVVRDALTQDFEKPADSVVTAGDLIGSRRE